MSLKNVLQKNSTYYAVFALLTVLSALFTGFFLKPYFITNDDLLIRSVLNGVYTGKPEAYLIYVMFPLGLIFKGFYTVFPKVGWYEIFTFSMHFICIFLICLRLDRIFFGGTKTKKEGIFRIISAFAFFFATFGIHLQYIVQNQYTVLAGFIAATSLLYFSTVRPDESEKRFFFDALVCVLTFTLSLWLRKEACFMMLPVFFLIAVVRLCADSAFRKGINRILILCGFLIVILVCSLLLHKAVYRSVEWKEFEAFNKARTDVYDYGLMPGYDDNKEFYNSLGIGRNEFTALQEYSLNLTESANTGNFEKMAEKQKVVQKERERYYSVFSKIVKDTMRSLGVIAGYASGIGTMFAAVAAVIISAVLIARKKQIWPFIINVALILYYVVFVAYFTYLNRLPDRVFVPLLYAMTVGFVAGVVIALSGRTEPADAKKKEIIKTAAVIFLFAGSALVLFTAGRKLLNDRDYFGNKCREFDDINAYVANRPKDVFLITQSVNATQCKMLFGGEEETTNYVRSVDWCYQSPLMRDKYRYLGIDSASKLLLEENVYILMNEYIDPQYAVNLTIKDGGQAAQAILFDKIETGDNVTVVWKIETIEAETTE